MRKVFLSFILITMFDHSYSQTSVYHPFPTSDALWREYRKFPKGMGAYDDYDYHQFISGDTLINGKMYHKIYKSGNAGSGCMSGPSCNSYAKTSYYQNKLTGYFREDASKHIYAPGQPTEELLYDFNITVGDTIKNSSGTPLDCFKSPQYYLKVASIDSVLIGGVFHKRFNIDRIDAGSSTFYTSIIEGVGATTGLFSLRTSYCNLYYSQLLCFMQNNITVYPDGQSCNLAVVSGINELSFQKSVIVYPNPGKGEFTFKGLDKENKIELYDNTGRLTYQTICTDVIQTITLNDKAIGIYFYRISTVDGKISAQGKISIEK